MRLTALINQYVLQVPLPWKTTKEKKKFQGKHIPTHISKAAQYGNMEFRHRGKSTRGL